MKQNDLSHMICTAYDIKNAVDTELFIGDDQEYTVADGLDDIIQILEGYTRDE